MASDPAASASSRSARAPTRGPWLNLSRLGLAFGRAIGGVWTHGDLFSGAAISFYALFSMLPMVILFAIILGAAFPNARVDRILGRLLGGDVHPGILVQTVQEAYDHRGSYGWWGSLTLILSSTGVFGALQIALDRVFECKGRFLAARAAVGALMMIGSLLIFIGVMVGTVLAVRLIRVVGLGPLVGIGITGPAGQAIAAFPAVAQFAIFWVGYRFLPNVPIRWREAWPGALIATVLWQIISYVLGVYIGRVADYTSLYQSLAVVVALLAWIYTLSCTFLFGAEVVAAYAPRRPMAVKLTRRGVPLPGEGDRMAR